MPREQINYPKAATGTLMLEGILSDTGGTATIAPDSPLSGEVVTRCAPVVHVGWQKDGWVQVAIEGDVSYFRFAAEHPDGETSDRSTVYVDPMSRDEINKLIRTLRRARDQVFGRDE